MDNPDDNISFINFNSVRKGLLAMPKDSQSTYLSSIFENAPPDICFLPGDDRMANLNAIRGYEQYTIPNAKDTVLLYDNRRIKMTKPNVNFNSFGHMANLDFNEMVVPQVEVFSLQPYQRVVREFSIVSWRYDFFEVALEEPEILAEKIIKFAQRLALVTGIPVLIGGEMSIGYKKLNEIVKKLCKDYQADFLASVQPDMSKKGYLPSMTKASLKPLRQLFNMKVLRCETKEINGSVMEQQVGGTCPDKEASNCFIASKSLNLTEPTFVDMNGITGREVRMPSLQTFRPTQCSMEIPMRPPTHSGG